MTTKNIQHLQRKRFLIPLCATSSEKLPFYLLLKKWHKERELFMSDMCWDNVWANAFIPIIEII